MSSNKRLRRSPYRKQANRTPLLVGIAAAGLAALGGIYALTSRLDNDNPPTSSSSESAPPQQGIEHLSCSYRFEQVLAKSVSLQDYLTDAASCTPELLALKRDGILLGIVTQPDFGDIERRVIAAIRSEDTKNRTQHAISDYKTNPFYDGTNASVFPEPTYILGKGVPQYIIVSPNFLSDVLVRDADAQGVLLHEAQHVKDGYFGIKIAGITITAETLENGSIGTTFFNYLSESRAHRLELEIIGAQLAKTGKTGAGSEYITWVAQNYVQEDMTMRQIASTELEKKIAAVQEGSITYKMLPRGAFQFEYAKDGLTSTFSIIPR